ncbi:hypothetical protein [Lonsdalea iberica]|nr:hypothetical protein [Lonsdalea iberica]
MTIATSKESARLILPAQYRLPPPPEMSRYGSSLAKPADMATSAKT